MISIVLAAGKGTRMKSDISKLMAKANGEPIISIVDRILKDSNISKNIFILGYLKEQILDFMPNIDYVVQSEQLGTAHAIIIAKNKIESINEDILVCNGDGPLLKSSTLIKMREKFERENYDALLLSCDVSNPYGYGRICKENEKVLDIVEESEANIEQKLINEVNAGVYMFKRESLLKIIDKFDNNNSKGEYYITDSVKLLNSLGFKVGSFKIKDENEMLGVNSKSQLAQVSKILRNRKKRAIVWVFLLILREKKEKQEKKKDFIHDTHKHLYKITRNFIRFIVNILIYLFSTYSNRAIIQLPDLGDFLNSLQFSIIWTSQSDRILDTVRC